MSGVLLLDKPSGITSSTAVQKVRRLLDRAKAGHTGTLDPLATGLLPVCLGEATKFSHPILASDKTYLATLRLGWRSSTGDAEGELSAVARPGFSDEQLAESVKALRGEIDQVPPMYSAVRVGGERLYTLARKGLSAKRKPRRVCIHKLEVAGRAGDDLQISVSCSKGTYVRVLAEDLGDLLGCGAYLTALRRTAIGSLDLSDAVDLDSFGLMPEEQRRAMLKPVDLLLAELPRLELGDEQSRRLLHGLTIPAVTAAPAPQIRIYSSTGQFLGLGEVRLDRSLRPKRLLSQAFWDS